MNILIVDDLPENRKFLQSLLEGYGQCDMASNGQEALDLFEAAITDDDPYDLVLLDIMMPGMDGQEVLLKTRFMEKEYGIRDEDESVIIMVTALQSPRHVLEAFFKGGCTDYTEKPVSRNNLFKKLREYNL